MAEKIQKLLAHAGVGSRREVERWIQEGRVTVDGLLAHVGQRIEPGVEIRIDNQIVKLAAAVTQNTSQVLLYHKPLGEICSRHDPEGRPSIFDNLPELAEGRWINIGRLDINSSGILLLTNEGELAHRLMHPSYQVERTYLVRVIGAVTEEDLQRLRDGIDLEEGLAKCEVEVHQPKPGRANQWFRMVLKEGKNREVRRLWQALGYDVNKLIRIRYGTVALPHDLKPGAWQLLTPQHIEKLRHLVGL